MREDWNTHLQDLRGKRDVQHLPFWNSFPWEVNSFPELQNINAMAITTGRPLEYPWKHHCSMVREYIDLDQGGGLAIEK
jgi:hypothetical protein